VVKISLWLLQVGVAVVIIGLWIATAVGIGDKVRRHVAVGQSTACCYWHHLLNFFLSVSFLLQDISGTDSFESTCAIGTKFQ
jgi:hypothetical protein